MSSGPLAYFYLFSA